MIVPLARAIKPLKLFKVLFSPTHPLTHSPHDHDPRHTNLLACYMQ